jgi:hypothetical protein
MGHDSSEPPADTTSDDGLHLRVSRRTLRRAGLVALVLAVAAAGLGAGLRIADDGDHANGEETTARHARRHGSTTDTAATATSLAAAGAPTGASGGPGADASGAVGGTESTDEGAAVAPAVDAPAADPADPVEPAAPAAPEPGPPTVSLTLTALRVNCGTGLPTLKASFTTVNAIAVSLSLDGGLYEHQVPVNGSRYYTLACGQQRTVRASAVGVRGPDGFAVQTVLVG